MDKGNSLAGLVSVVRRGDHEVSKIDDPSLRRPENMNNAHRTLAKCSETKPNIRRCFHISLIVAQIGGELSALTHTTAATSVSVAQVGVLAVVGSWLRTDGTVQEFVLM